MAETPPNGQRRQLLFLISGYLAFCMLSLLSRAFYPLFGIVVLAGVAVPLLWGGITGEWSSMGFSGRHLSLALVWGAAGGTVSSLAGLAVLAQWTFTENLARQLLIAIPLWLFLISPFQEFFFRGWLQSGLVKTLGRPWGLTLTILGFTAWHYVSPILDLADFPLATIEGFLSTLVAALAYGIAFDRGRNILAPWLAHAISGLAFVAVGAMDLLQVVQ